MCPAQQWPTIPKPIDAPALIQFLAIFPILTRRNTTNSLLAYVMYRPPHIGWRIQSNSGHNVARPTPIFRLNWMTWVENFRERKRTYELLTIVLDAVLPLHEHEPFCRRLAIVHGLNDGCVHFPFYIIPCYHQLAFRRKMLKISIILFGVFRYSRSLPMPELAMEFSA